MPLNQAIILPPLQEQLWDKTLNVPLAGGFVRFFIDGTLTPKNVYELVGTNAGNYTYVSLGSELTLSGIGTYIDENGGNIPIYLWPFLGSPNDQPPNQTVQNYYIQVYSSTGVFQFDIHNWPGFPANAEPIESQFDTTENVISNSQFVDVTFSTAATQSSPVTYNTSNPNQVTEIAPDWSVVTNGSGSFSVWQIPVTDNTPDIGNPAYALGITSSSYLGPITLRQRILAPRLLASRYVFGSFIASSNNGSYTLTMNYTPSITGTIQQICMGTSVNSTYTIIEGSAPTFITNPGSGTGYIDITIVIPVGASVNISCVQLVGVDDDAETVAYIEESPEREIDHLFHYFQPQINFKPIPSLLVGWDFPLNPAQFGASQTGSTTPAYIWDQTIMASAANNLTITRDANTMGLKVVTTGNTDAFYLLQYLDGGNAMEATLSNLSINIAAYSANMTNVVVRPYLFVGPGGTIPILNTTIGTIATNGIFTLTSAAMMAGWVPIPNIYSSAPMSALSMMFGDIGFNGYTGKSNLSFSSTGVVFAIVIAFQAPTTATQVIIDSISCVPGDIPTRPAPQAFSEVMRECQYYYELASSFAVLMNSVGGGSSASYASPFQVNYQQIKRVAPSTVSSPKTFTVTSTATTAANVSAVLYYDNGAAAVPTSLSDTILYGAFAFWSQYNFTTAYISFVPVFKSAMNTASGSSTYSSAEIIFNYKADARLGIV